MNRLLGGNSANKRKRLDSSSPADALTPEERKLFDVIRSREDMGIWTRDMKRETNLPDNMVNKSMKSLLAKKLIKEVPTIQNKGRKHYMASEFEPSKEITGGDWYSDGSLDHDYVNVVKQQFEMVIRAQNIATLEGIADAIRRKGSFKVEFSRQQVEEIVNALVLDNLVMEVKSNGLGEFDCIPVGKVCYKCINRGGGMSKGEVKADAMASIPCGVCPRISYCTPDGVISPITCVYYAKWLDF